MSGSWQLEDVGTMWKRNTEVDWHQKECNKENIAAIGECENIGTEWEWSRIGMESDRNET